MSWLADQPVQRKLRFAMLFTSSIALVLVCVFFLVFEYRGSRLTIEQTITALARVTASNSTAAIAFADPADARENLVALRAETQVLAAVLYDRQGGVIASYVARPGQAAPTAAPEFRGTRYEAGELIHVEPVVQESRHLGTLYIRATLAQLQARMRMYAGIVLVVLLASVTLAWIVASVLQRTIARPILELAQTADAVSAGSDFSLRAKRYGSDELGRLTLAFNSMLERTQNAVGALRESEARFRHLADAAPVLIWLADTSRACVWVNQRWIEFVGRGLEQLAGDGRNEDIHPDDRAQAVGVYEQAFAARTSFQAEYRLRHRSGEYRWFIDRGIPRFGARGEFTGYIGSCVDVTDRKQAEEEIARARDRALAASRAKDEFLAALSHELRTPLNPVLLIASDAAQNPDLPAEVRADFDLIAKNVSLEARLIDDLLDLTRIVRGKLSLDLRPRDVHAALQDAIATVWSDLEAKRIRLRLDLQAAQTVVWGDSVRLQQVFWNVLKNAVKFTPEEGEVSVRTWSDAQRGRMSVQITDTGIGLTPTELERIFEAFSQGDHAEGSKGHRFGGLGLGLAISRMLVELHAGTIRAESPGRDRGASFTIELPVSLEDRVGQDGQGLRMTAQIEADGADSKAENAPPASPRGDGLRVLVVEDHVATGRTLAQLLERRGFVVQSAASVEEARRAVDQARPDLVVSDIGLPDGDGLALLMELRARFPQLRALALSGYGAEQDIARSQAAGFTDHLTKPIAIDALDRALERLMHPPAQRSTAPSARLS